MKRSEVVLYILVVLAVVVAAVSLVVTLTAKKQGTDVVPTPTPVASKRVFTSRQLYPKVYKATDRLAWMLSVSFSQGDIQVKNDPKTPNLEKLCASYFVLGTGVFLVYVFVRHMSALAIVINDWTDENSGSEVFALTDETLNKDQPYERTPKTFVVKGTGEKCALCFSPLGDMEAGTDSWYADSRARANLCIVEL